MTREIKDSDIRTINPIDHARLRPGMHFGGVDQKALHQLLWITLEDAAEEIMGGNGDHIWITLKAGNEVSIRDNGSGISTHIVENHKKSWLELYLTQPGIYLGRRGKPFDVIYGLHHGIGLLPAVNGVSSSCVVEVQRDGYLWKQSYKEGVPQSEVVKVRILDEHESTGTTITFTPDYTIFEQNDFQYELIVERARELAYLIPRLTVIVRDERANPQPEARFYFPTGLTNMVQDLNEGHSPLHEVIAGSDKWVDKDRGRKVKVDFALQYNDSMETIERSYANNIYTRDGGTHLAGIQSAFAAIITQYANEVGEVAFTHKEIEAGLTIAVRVQLEHVNFENQTQMKLINPEIFGIVVGIVHLKLNSVREA